MLCVQIVTKFLFHCGFHTKKTLRYICADNFTHYKCTCKYKMTMQFFINGRGPAMEWYETLHPYLMFSAKIRRWFMETVFFNHKERFSEYLLECPSTEVFQPNMCAYEVWSHSFCFCAQIRSVFAKMITFICWISNKDAPFEVEVTTNAGMGKYGLYTITILTVTGVCNRLLLCGQQCCYREWPMNYCVQDSIHYHGDFFFFFKYCLLLYMLS